MVTQHHVNALESIVGATLKLLLFFSFITTTHTPLRLCVTVVAAWVFCSCSHSAS